MVCFANFIKDHPSSVYKEEALFLIVKSYYLLADASIDTKKAERYQLAIDNYYKFVELFPKGKYLKDVENLYEKSKKQKEKLI